MKKVAEREGEGLAGIDSVLGRDPFEIRPF